VERTFAVVKRVFNGGRVLVTSLPRVRVKMFFSCLCFNLLQLGSLVFSGGFDGFFSRGLVAVLVFLGVLVVVACFSCFNVA
jgi:hypothetical protein